MGGVGEKLESSWGGGGGVGDNLGPYCVPGRDLISTR